jgi:hypothetical protein
VNPEELVHRLAALGPRFAERAEGHDRAARFPEQNFEELREAGLLGITVPREHGGLGADFAGYCLASEELGRWCGSTALALNMHASVALWIGLVADALEMTPAQREDHAARRALHFQRVVQGGELYAISFSEGGPAAAGAAPWATTARKVEGGYVVSGHKIFVSLAGAAHWYCVLATLERPGEEGRGTSRDALALAVPASAAGCRVHGVWDPLGMRATVSRNLTLENVFVPEENRLLPEGLYHQAAQRWPAMFFTLAPTYMGLARAAYDFTVAYLRAELPGMPPVRRRMYPTKQHAVAEMRIKLEATRALFLQCAREAAVDPDAAARLRLFAAQYSVMENAHDICRLALRTCGGQGMARGWPLERLFRDSRCGALMLPWTAELCIDRLGRGCLYEAQERDEAIEQ